MVVHRVACDSLYCRHLDDWPASPVLVATRGHHWVLLENSVFFRNIQMFLVLLGISDRNAAFFAGKIE